MALRDWAVAKAGTVIDTALTMSATSLVCVAVILLWEVARLGLERSSLASIRSGDPSARRDLISWALDITGVLRAIGHITTLGIGFLVGAAIKSVLNLNLTGLLANPYLAVIAFLFSRSFFDYWMHRAMHHSVILWEIHKYHHSADEMNVVSSHRDSILVAPFVSIFLAIPFGIIGVPPHIFVIATAVLEFQALLVHSRLPIDFGWFERMLISPRAHRLHHARDLSRGTRNYGFVLSIWDHAFGTYERAPSGQFPVGLDTEVYNTAPWHREMLHSVRATARAAWTPVVRRRTVAN